MNFVDFEIGQTVWLVKGDLPGAERGLVKGEVVGYKILDEGCAILKAKLSTSGRNRNFTIYRQKPEFNFVFCEQDEQQALKKAQKWLRFNLGYAYLPEARAKRLAKQLI